MTIGAPIHLNNNFHLYVNKLGQTDISGNIAAYQTKIAQTGHDLARIIAVNPLGRGGEQERAQYIITPSPAQR
jgi:hypothetical protein